MILRRNLFAEMDARVKNLLLFMSRRLWTLQRYSLEGNSLSLLAKRTPGSQQDLLRVSVGVYEYISHQEWAIFPLLGCFLIKVEMLRVCALKFCVVSNKLAEASIDVVWSSAFLIYSGTVPLTSLLGNKSVSFCSWKALNCLSCLFFITVPLLLYFTFN